MPKIPKILHYFYDDIDIFKKGVKPHFRMCYMSWIRACEGYEIRLVSDKSDEFSQMLKNSRFLREVYKRKIWALVSDYVRYFVLFHNGGIYLDTDVELLGNFDAFLDEGAFCSVEGDLYKNENVLESAVIGGLKGHIFFKKNA